MPKKILAFIFILSIIAIGFPTFVLASCSNCDLPAFSCNGDTCLKKTTLECVDDSICKNGQAFPQNLCISPSQNETKVCYASPQSYENLNDKSKDAGLIFTSIEKDLQIKKPILSINVPGLDLSSVKSQIDQDGYLYLPWVGEYLTGIYNFGMAIASIVAVIMIIVEGVKIILSGTSEGKQEKTIAYKRLGQIIIGMMILWGSYAILWNINPDLVRFKALKIEYIKPEPIPYFGEPDFVDGQEPTDLVLIKGDNITNWKKKKTTKELLPLLIKAAQLLKTQEIKLTITDGVRLLEEQTRLIKENCQNPVGSTKGCNPKVGKPQTCILKNNKLKNCPHTTGRAIDAWGFKDGKQCIKQKKCKKNKANDPCHEDPCQKAVIDAMKKVGFCNLSSEAWHFERPKMSGNCE